jgi:hypothetical protein
MEQMIGKLTQWDNAKKSGVVRSTYFSGDVYVSLSAFGDLPRKPMTGDVVILDSISETNGTRRATRARIKGLESGQKVFRKTSGFSIIITLIIAIAILLAIWAVDHVKFPGLPVVTNITTPKTLNAPLLNDEGGK